VVIVGDVWVVGVVLVLLLLCVDGMQRRICEIHLGRGGVRPARAAHASVQTFSRSGESYVQYTVHGLIRLARILLAESVGDGGDETFTNLHDNNK
jgi:hypothetical protein